MADPKHVEILKQGVKAWNQWRKDNPDVKPNLSNIVFADVFKDSAVWGDWPWGVKPPGAEGDRGVVLRDANLSGADLVGANLSGAKLVAATLTDANFFNADVTDADFTRVIWKPSKRFRQAPGQGLPAMRNNPGLQRYWSDELFIDAERAPLESAVPKTRQDLFALHRPLRKPEWVILALLGALIGFIAGAPEAGGALLGHLQSPAAWIPVASGFGVGALLGLFFSAFWGRRLVFMLWGLFDYGRSWPAVAFLALVLVTLFGSLYSVWLVPGGHMQWSAGDPGAGHWFYPWFVAAMGFATLGIADVAKPVSGLGQLMMMANVLAGFTTFGLLLSVLGNTFARRAG